MGFIMDGLDAEAYDRNYSDRQLIARSAPLAISAPNCVSC